MRTIAGSDHLDRLSTRVGTGIRTQDLSDESLVPYCSQLSGQPGTRTGHEKKLKMAEQIMILTLTRQGLHRMRPKMAGNWCCCIAPSSRWPPSSRPSRRSSTIKAAISRKKACKQKDAAKSGTNQNNHDYSFGFLYWSWSLLSEV